VITGTKLPVADDIPIADDIPSRSENIIVGRKELLNCVCKKRFQKGETQSELF
jgi:hypothetical protein